MERSVPPSRLTLYWFHGDLGRQFVFAPNWLEALGLLLPEGGRTLPRRLACEVGSGGRVVVRDMDRGQTYLLVPDHAALEEVDHTEELPIEATSDSVIPY